MPKGAKGKLTKELIEKAADIIARGNYYKVAIDILGIDDKTWYNWLRQGEIDANKGINSLNFQFFQSIKKAEAELRACKAASKNHSKSRRKFPSKNTWAR